MKKSSIALLSLWFFACMPSKKDQYFYFFSNLTSEVIDVKIYNTKSKEFIKTISLSPNQKVQYFEEKIGEGDGSGVIFPLKVGGDSAVIFKNNVYK